MFETVQSPIAHRVRKLEEHLRRENPVLLEVVKSFRMLDKVAYGLGVLQRDESFATRVPWWPMISVLGTFSSGKSTFINDFLGHKLQLSGNQAVDDKFTVICFSGEDSPRVLPGLALDADPRFPFYQVSRDIEEVAEGEGSRVDSYLQLKTCPSEELRGKILIDSPGFDADDQRNATLRITDHIIDLSDLVLVLFDARHPEPGAMQDTLTHLVKDTISRPDANKFMYILNQIDTAAREDNPEEVFAAWQRALAQAGLVAGRFYRIYNPEAAMPIENPKLRQRFEEKRAVDVGEIHGRMQQVEVERAYRIIGVLEKTAKVMENELVPRIREAKHTWKKRVLWLDGIVFGLIAAGALGLSIYAGWWQGLTFAPPWLERVAGDSILLGAALLAILGAGAYLHHLLRKLAARSVEHRLRRDTGPKDMKEWLLRAFAKNTRPWRTSLSTRPAGWGPLARRRLVRILADADRYVQTLNNNFANPSGGGAAQAAPIVAADTPRSTAPAPDEEPPAAMPADAPQQPVKSVSIGG